MSGTHAQSKSNARFARQPDPQPLAQAMRGTAAPTLAGLATSYPSHGVDAAATITALCSLFPAEDPEFIAGVVRNSGVEQRQLALPQERLLALRDFTARNAAWREACIEHGARAARAALQQAGVQGDEIDVIVDVSCTGLAIPALDTDLADALGLRPDVLRVPVTAAGCAGGALGLGLAMRLAAGGKTVLLVAMEMCTLTFVPGDAARANLVAGALFGDGAGAAVLGPRGAGPRLRAARSHLFPGTRHAMGFEVGTHGLRIQLDRTLPVMLERGLRAPVEAFLAAHDLTVADVGLHLVHTGGRRVLDVYQSIFGLAEDELRASRESLRKHGNLSSASILSVLDEARRLGLGPRTGRHALIVAFGPGLSAEFILLDWA
jgi:alkylresorcinol/alkylpyrone synthase